MAFSLEGFADIVNGKILLAQGNDLVADGVAFRRAVWPFLRLNEKGTLGVLAELVAKHAETAGGIAKAFGDFMGREALDKIGPQRLVLPMGRIGWFEEDTLKLC